jgi:hypothetical protein
MRSTATAGMQFMCFNVRLASVFVLLLCGGALLLTGCGSEQAGANTQIASSGEPIPAADAKAASQQKPKLRPGAKTVVLSKAGDKPYDKTFDDLRFNLMVGEKFKRSMLTKGIEGMNGEKIRIRGYILPTPQKHGIRQFVLVRDNQECCFGPGAALYDCILVEMKGSNTADFTIRPIAVEGTFNVREFAIDGKDLAIYQMDGELAR